jgi:preprotein translocase subunit SecE
MAKEKNTKNEKTKTRSFGKDFRAELKKVVWPTSKQMVNNVTAVLTIVIITALIVFVLDLGFGAMNKYGVDKLKAKVQKNNTVTQVVEDTTTPVEGSEGESQDTTTEETPADATAVETTETEPATEVQTAD